MAGFGCAALSLASPAHETAYSSMASYKYTGYNKASPLGASLCNTYKNNNIPTGAGAHAYAREVLPKALSLYSCGGSDKKSKIVARVFGRFRGYIWRALKFLKKVFLFWSAQTSSMDVGRGYLHKVV